jgi:hypothetical protein
MIFEKTNPKFFPGARQTLISLVFVLGASPTAFAMPNDTNENATANSVGPVLVAQTLELRDTAIPAKTLDDSGLKHLEDPLSKKPTQVLEGSLRKDELAGHVTLSQDKKTLTLYAVNHGKRALIFSGDQATVSTSSSMEQKALTRNEVISPPPKSEVPKDIGLVAVSIVSDGAVPTIYDMATAYQPDGLAYYGKDQVRRRTDERRFGQRTLFPGESTTGRVYLPVSVTDPKELIIPITVHPSGESLGSIILSVEQ